MTPFAGLPADVGALARVVQGLLIHEHIGPTYGVAFDQAKHAQAHVRPVETMLKSIAANDPRPLSTARTPDRRQVGVCRHFTVLHVAMLRDKGIEARARCGFGAYFGRGKYVDHWVTEYRKDGRWRLADSQIDDHQRKLFGITFDTLDVPREQFLVAGDAWRLARGGKADPEAFGILDMGGLWFIAGNLVRDLAALNDRVMLPWDIWGAMVRDDAGLDIPLFDRLAELTREPDRHRDELHALYQDERFAVPHTVFNAVLNRPEQV